MENITNVENQAEKKFLSLLEIQSIPAPQIRLINEFPKDYEIKRYTFDFYFRNDDQPERIEEIEVSVPGAGKEVTIYAKRADCCYLVSVSCFLQSKNNPDEIIFASEQFVYDQGQCLWIDTFVVEPETTVLMTNRVRTAQLTSRKNTSLLSNGHNVI